MTRRPAFPSTASSPDGQRTLAGIGELVREMFRPGSFLRRLAPGNLLRPVATGTPLRLAWGEMNRLPIGNSVARLPQIRPEWIGVPLHVLKDSSDGFAEVQPAGMTIDGTEQPTVDGNTFGLWMRDAGMRTLMTDGTNWFSSSGSKNGLQVFNVLDYGAGADMPASVNVRAIQAAIDAAEAAGGGVVLFPGGTSTLYPVDAQLTVTKSHVKLWAPGRARLLVASASIKFLIAVGNIDTGANLAQANTLASDSAKGSQTVTLTAGKGANITAGATIVIWSQGIVPDHDSAVVNWRAEIVNVYSKATDTLTLAAPLRFDYTTADSAQVYVIDWIEGFEVDGLGVDGNDQMGGSTFSGFLQMSWCLKPSVRNMEAVNLAQRFVRFQGCLQHHAQNIRQTNGLSSGFVGTGFSYVTHEHGLCQDGIIEDVFADRCRHGYTTGAGWTNNNGTTTTVFTGSSSIGFGVPMDTIVGPGVHHNARGAGWDTHEVGMDITFRHLKTIGGLQIGFQDRCVRTRFIDCFARDCIGAALQTGGDAQGTIIESLDWENVNLGTDVATSFNWTTQSPIVDNGVGSRFGKVPRANVVDNGSFDLWERLTSTNQNGGTANRWHLSIATGSAVEVRRRTHDSASSGPQSAKYYLRFTPTSIASGVSKLIQRIEDVRTLAGQRVALSFDARDSINGSPLKLYLSQHFGTGGSPSSGVDSAVATRVIDGNWRRRNAVFDVPSIASKTIGSNEDSATLLTFEVPNAASGVFFDLDRVKLEVGRTPTDFTPAPMAETVARCGRWYEKSYSDSQLPGSLSVVGSVFMADSVASENYYKATVPFSTRKGGVPDIIIFAPGVGLSGYIRNQSTTGIIQASIVNVGNSAFTAGPASATGMNPGDVTQFQWTAAVPDFY